MTFCFKAGITRNNQVISPVHNQRFLTLFSVIKFSIFLAIRAVGTDRQSHHLVLSTSGLYPNVNDPGVRIRQTSSLLQLSL